MAPIQREVHMSLRNVALVILEGEAERTMLKQDLEGMGYVGEGSVPDPGANLGGNKPLAGRGATAYIGASLDVAKGPRPN